MSINTATNEVANNNLFIKYTEQKIYFAYLALGNFIRNYSINQKLRWYYGHRKDLYKISKWNITSNHKMKRVR